ncbi:KRI1 family protein [Aspergillus saccharolyticus JOP 1030-1]|uniref:Ribosome biogenesis protein Kri1 n=1 Tax=Aspergillus saccharolyticus JOP 1030-1 TaxID=1450539 RepID=A0A318Z7G1_9EURO|nr:ribosome biogenesis protein Kri1 [Aspergillus saccharolyticus JOP 1030-1]PYH43261.1 ribosome biogenesis protein Kri1 [Aspergillus saccharolyticus JOP 1030-1]
MEPSSKRSRKLLDDSSSDSEDESGGVPISNEDVVFKINEDYARRFEYNKKREEMVQLESKLGKSSVLGKRRDRDDEEDSEEESSSEEEDDFGELATEAVDVEIMETIKAIRSKDPRLYDPNAKFFTKLDEEEQPQNTGKKEKPMTLRDYHRENLLSGANLADEEDTSNAPKTYAQEQADLKNAIVKEMHAAIGDEDAAEKEEEDDFLVAKSKPESFPETKTDANLDIENADKDPETFLSNFLSSRAWIPAGRSELQPFESDDEEEDQRAEAFEEAYNFRFEDPSKMNATLMTHSRDATNQQSVRREEKSMRKKRRDAEREQKEQEKKQREIEKNRLRKLKMEELQEKVEKIKEVAGIHGTELTDEDWAHFLDDAWDGKDWEAEMQKRFGEDYYAEAGADGTKHPKKPTWDDDIDIKDLVPEYEDEEEKAVMADSDVDMEDEQEGEKKKSKAQERRDQKRESRKDRMRVEEAVDRNLDLDISLLPGATKKNATGFRYRETSPQSFGLTARDILMADDNQLNQFAGLKKLASYRDPEKKAKDQRKLGKKARLRQWRKDTFGNEEGPRISEEAPKAPTPDTENVGKVDIRDGEPSKKKRKRSKKH